MFVFLSRGLLSSIDKYHRGIYKIKPDVDKKDLGQGNKNDAKRGAREREREKETDEERQRENGETG